MYYEARTFQSRHEKLFVFIGVGQNQIFQIPENLVGRSWLAPELVIDCRSRWG